jgi:uncharacterized protein YdeI (YjbR/CyaY-like superfamily)
MDGRKNNRGTKGNKGGRKSKAEEIKLVEKLDALIDPNFAIEKMYEHITDGSEKMLELYMGYRFGKPKQSHDHTNDGSSFENNPIIVFGKDE